MSLPMASSVGTGWVWIRRTNPTASSAVPPALMRAKYCTAGSFCSTFSPFAFRQSDVCRAFGYRLRAKDLVLLGSQLCHPFQGHTGNPHLLVQTVRDHLRVE